MAAAAHIFGVRHHGPGSARRLIEALDELSPSVVLIEGPSDLSHLLPLLAAPSMIPPVALLAYPTDDPAQALFWPFATFSPEYQAARWAAGRGVEARFIDLPTSWRLRPAEPDTARPDNAEAAPEDRAEAPVAAAQGGGEAMGRDPIGALAAAAGYEDGESWWRDVIEENQAPGPVFAAVAEAMTALRDHAPPPEGFEAAREAHMRLEIARAQKESEGPVAVVCGAWHAPALVEKRSAKSDRALIKGGPKRRISATWAPWTAPRLAYAGGYGAGVSAPGWCLHLWETSADQLTTRWIARIAAALRAQGQLVSTASLIETQRLAMSLAALRDRPQPGFEELRDAAVACLCFGAPLIWRGIADELLIGSQVGAIPEDAPMAPLLEDLQRAQRTARLKPEALERELALDLRTESGRFRSTLLHRLNALNAPWGVLQDAGGSRGTFRERWALRWEPEYAVALVENLVHGPTIERAANGRLTSLIHEASDLGRLAELVFSAMTAQLGAAVEKGVVLLGERAALTSDCSEMLRALPPLADVLRYGEARATDSAHLGALFHRIAVQGALALPYAVRNLDAEAAEATRRSMKASDAAIRLIEADGGEASAQWRQALERVVADAQAARLVAGAAARLLYEADGMTPEDAVALLRRMLSPGTPVADAAAFFAGFFEGGGQRLIYDQGLRDCVDAWLSELDGEAFVEHLPLFRRVFSQLDKMERKRLLDAAIGGGAVFSGLTPAPEADRRWAAQLERLKEILAPGERLDDG